MKLKFLGRYSSQTLEVQKKAVVLFIVSMISFVMLVVTGASDLLTADYTSVIFESLLVVLCGADLLLLVRGRFDIASSIFILMSAVFLPLIVISKPYVIPDEVFKTSLYSLIPIMLCSLVGYKAWQVAASAGIALSSVLYIFFFRIMPARARIDPHEIPGYLIIPIVFIVLAGVIAYLTLRIEKQVIQTAVKESGINMQRVLEISDIFETSKAGIEVGEQLSTLSASAVRDLDSISAKIDGIQMAIDDFLSNVRMMGESNSSLLVSKSVVANELINQSAAVEGSSGEIEKIVASINRIVREAAHKKALIDELIATGEKSSEFLSDTVASIEKVADSSSNVLDIASVIEGIASRTGLLAMNASIEAAHAGEYGKGFAIVADEIRKLSDETNENSGLIKQTLEANAGNINAATGSNKKSAEVFHNMLTQITVTSGAFNEIINVMSKLEEMTSGIKESVTHLRSMHDKVASSIGSMEEVIASNSGATGTIEASSIRLRSDINDILEKTRNILDAVSRLDEIGKKNRLNIANLSDGIGKITTI